MHLTEKKIEPFLDWLSRRIGKTRSEFMKLGIKDREEIFLRWKWGFTNPKANQELQFTRNYLIQGVEDQGVENIDNPEDRRYWELAINYEQKSKDWAEDVGIKGLIHVGPKHKSLIDELNEQAQVDW